MMISLWIIGVLGALFGSFYGVIIARWPEQLKYRWRLEAEEACAELPPYHVPPPNLLFPPSHCTQCGILIRWYHNLPILSFLWLKGRCAYCQQRIGIWLWCVELGTLVLAIGSALTAHTILQACATFFLVSVLWILAWIDARTYYLPDEGTLSLLWCGLLGSLLPDWPYANTHEAVLGAALGYLLLRGTYTLYWLCTGRVGMGFGDFKLLAALGAWLGPILIGDLLFLAALSGSIFGVVNLLYYRRSKFDPIPFGPFLAAAGIYYAMIDTPIRFFLWDEIQLALWSI